MAKRFIDTSFFKSPFVRGLKGPLKTLYLFIICDCDGAGIWSYDLEAANLYTGLSVSENEFINSFVNSGKAIDLKNGRFFFPDFIEHQYPNGLSYTNPAHKNFINDLLSNSMIDKDLKVLKRPFEGSKVMVKVIDKVIVKDKVTVNIPPENEFLQFCGSFLNDKYLSYEFSLKAKYESWVLNDWKDGNGNKIKNWKSKIKNTVPYLKPDNSIKQNPIQGTLTAYQKSINALNNEFNITPTD